MRKKLSSFSYLHVDLMSIFLLIAFNPSFPLAHLFKMDFSPRVFFFFAPKLSAFINCHLRHCVVVEASRMYMALQCFWYLS